MALWHRVSKEDMNWKLLTNLSQLKIYDQLQYYERDWYDLDWGFLVLFTQLLHASHPFSVIFHFRTAQRGPDPSQRR